MRGPDRMSLGFFWALTAFVLFAGNASAYVGPGAGMELVGYAMSLLAWVAVAFFSVMMWPLYSFVRWFRTRKAAPTDAAPPVTEEPTPSEPKADELAQSSSSPLQETEAK